MLAGLVWAMQTGRSLMGPIGRVPWRLAGGWGHHGLCWARPAASRRDYARLFRLPRADWGKLLAHAGMGVTILGIAGLTAWQEEDIRVAQIGETF